MTSNWAMSAAGHDESFEARQVPGELQSYIRVRLPDLNTRYFVCINCSRRLDANRYECPACPGVFFCNKCFGAGPEDHLDHGIRRVDTAARVAAARREERPSEEGDDGLWIPIPPQGCPTCFGYRPGDTAMTDFDYTWEGSSWRSHHSIFVSDLRASASRDCELCTLAFRGLSSLFAPAEVENQRIALHVHPKLIGIEMIGATRLSFKEHISFKPRVGIQPPWRGLSPALELPQDFNSEGCFRKLREWLTDCETSGSHVRCLSNPGPVQLPSRVLQIDDGGNQSQLRLRTTTGSEGRYVALSHCWGPEPFIQTTRDNYQAFQIAIDESTLPKSFRDAITCAREIGVSFVWIDSLCIVQDDSEDWQVESAKMCDVYANAYLVVVAASAPGAAAGFLGERPSRYAGVPFKSSESKPQSDFIAQRLMHHTYGYTATRAWCLQETILAKRCVFFSQDEMIWECNSLLSCECGANDSPSISPETIVSRPGCFLGRHHDTSPPDQVHRPIQNLNKTVQLYNDWRLRVVRNFTNLALTRATDRLPALSGFAAILARQCGDKYLAGIWLADMPLGLLWHTDTDYDKRLQEAPLKYFAPSYSWLSVNRPIAYSFPSQLAEGKLLFTKMPLSVLSSWSDVPGLNPFGEVADGHLCLGGLMKSVMLERGYHNTPHLKYRIRDVKRLGQYFFLPDTWLAESCAAGSNSEDEKPTVARAKEGLPLEYRTKEFQTSVQVLLLAKTSWKPEIWPECHKKIFYASLVLGLSPTRSGAYERLGVYQVEFDFQRDAAAERDWLAEFENREIMIV